MPVLRHLPAALAAVLALAAAATACSGDAPRDGTGGSGLVMTPAPHPPDAPLTATQWTVTSLISGPSVSPVPAGAEGRAVFALAADGTASGSLGCNRFSAPVTVEGPRLTFGPLTTTRMACQGPVGDVERTLTALLGSGPLTWRIQGGALTLTAEDGEGLRAAAASAAE